MESVVEDQSQGGATLDARAMRLAASGRMVRQSDRFLKAIAGYDRVAIVAHDNPDPDALVTGWAVQMLIAVSDERRAESVAAEGQASTAAQRPEFQRRKIRLLAGGQITRAENIFLVERLGIPIELVSSEDERSKCIIGDDEAVVLVDCGLESTHHVAFRAGRRPDAIIDHHVGRPSEPTRTRHAPADGHSGDPRTENPRSDSCDEVDCDSNASFTTSRNEWQFNDSRPHIAAAVSIAISYLTERGIEPSVDLATAALYAMKTETRGGECVLSALDRRTLDYLTPIACHETLARIDEAPLPQAYYVELNRALQCTEFRSHAAFCYLENSRGAETTGEISDFLIRHEALRFVLCITRVGAKLNLSIRMSPLVLSQTEKLPIQLECELSAALLARRLLRGIGSGGGHRFRGGGQVELTEEQLSDPASLQRVLDSIRTRWFEVTGVGMIASTQFSED